MTIRLHFSAGGILSLGVVLFFTNARAEDKDAATEAAEMAKMTELGKPGANHQLLAERDGTWDCKVTFWMAPGSPPTISTGTAVRKSVMGGRYFVMNTTSSMQMPGPDGKMQSMNYEGMQIDGYDNLKGKFFSTWIDSMGTGLLISKGSYDASSKTFTYHLEEDMGQGKTEVRETLKIIDNDHNLFEWFEGHGGKEVKTMEITYTRKK